MMGLKSSIRFRAVQLGMVTLQAADLHRLHMARPMYVVNWLLYGEKTI